jgi:transcriptional regulator with GAF, ATPase, and Fis domain
VIAATHRHLAEAVREGHFREDLYYRLNVFPIRIPPLRERGRDILLMADAFAEQAADRFGRRRKKIAAAWTERLLSYHWPGNVRELHNIIEHAVITSRDDQLYPEITLGETPEEQPHARVPRLAPIMTAEEVLGLQRENILRALRACHGRISGAQGAAALLGMNPSTLRSQIRALGIEEG